jgi:hypothetical protein
MWPGRTRPRQCGGSVGWGMRDATAIGARFRVGIASTCPRVARSSEREPARKREIKIRERHGMPAAGWWLRCVFGHPGAQPGIARKPQRSSLRILPFLMLSGPRAACVALFSAKARADGPAATMC